MRAITHLGRLSGITGLTFILTACAATIPPVDVTRFHNAATQPIPTGTILVMDPALEEETFSRSIEQRTYEEALIRELQRVGYTPAGKDRPEFNARVSVDRARITAGGKRSPVSVGVGGNTGSYGSGVGVGIGINLGGRPKDIIATEMSVRISRQSDNQAVWEGRAIVEAKDGSPASQPALAASKLAEALFKDFPGESGTTIRIK